MELYNNIVFINLLKLIFTKTNSIFDWREQLYHLYSHLIWSKQLEILTFYLVLAFFIHVVFLCLFRLHGHWPCNIKYNQTENDCVYFVTFYLLINLLYKYFFLFYWGRSTLLFTSPDKPWNARNCVVWCSIKCSTIEHCSNIFVQ